MESRPGVNGLPPSVVGSEPGAKTVAVERRRNRLQAALVAILAAYWLALIVGTHTPRPPQVLLHANVSDKLLHLAAYAGLALLACLNIAFRWGLSWRRLMAVPLALAAYGVLDEVTQIPVGRECELLDWAADVIGATAGLAMFAAAAAIWRRPARRGE